jgi:hypothetical protein
VEPNKFAVRNQEANVRALRLQRREAVIRADAEEISVAPAGPGFDEFVAGALAAAERIEHIFPVAFAKRNAWTFFCCHPNNLGCCYITDWNGSSRCAQCRK